MSLKVLLVDDSKTVRDIIARTLDLAGLPVGEILQAANGKEAIELMDDHWVDLVFLDINMPVMNGIETIEQMRKDDLLAKIPVIVVSTEGSVERLRDFRRKGVRACIRKPFTPEQLRAVVEDVLDAEPQQLQQQSEGTLAEIACEVLEQVAFIFAQPVPLEAVKAPESSHVQALVTFSGHANGFMTLAAPLEMGALVAANMLGTQENDGQAKERAPDALTEVASIICSHALTARAGPDAMFDLRGGPLRQADAAEWRAALDSPDTAALVADEGPMLVSVTFEGEGA